MTRPTITPAPPVDSTPRGPTQPRALCVRCERRRPMRLDLVCAECAGVDVGDLPLSAPGEDANG